MKHTLVCVLKTGGQYTAHHVERLRAQAWRPIICLTDDPDVTEPKRPLTRNLAGWWSKLELFDHDFGGPVCYLDLDVTIQSLEWLEELDESTFYGMADAYRPGGCLLNSSIMVWDGKPRPEMFDGLTEQEMQHPGGDQQWIYRKLPIPFGMLEPPNVVSFKKHGKKPEFGVIVYHGKPKPWGEPRPYINLMPDSNEDKSKQYEFAWGALLDNNAVIGHRCQAKCWLTYRCLDGEIKPCDWLEKIEPIKLQTSSIRWLSSIPLADAYVWLLVISGRKKAMSCFSESRAAIANALPMHPGGALNFLRASAIIAYDHHLNGQGEEAKSIIKESIAQWQMMWPAFDPIVTPFRFAEMRGDCIALHVLMRMLQKIGENGLDGKFRTTAQWADSIIENDHGAFWWKSMLKLPISERKMW